MKLTIHGAARQVTGSMHLLQVGQYKILIDCGLDYEKDHNVMVNEDFGFRPEEIDVVILTHAHIDHSGNLPTLVRLGFNGQILCTPPTADLTELLLLDSVNIFLAKAQKGRSRGRKHKHSSGGPQPLYLHKHVMDTVERFVTISYNKPFRITGDIELTFIPAGHLLGAAAATLKINDNGEEKSIAFTGDIGRKNYPVLNDPDPLPPVDYIVSESTYGGRMHTKGKSVQETLIETIEKVCVVEQGRLIIPAFSIGRTQSLVFALNKIFNAGLLPPVKVFVDSPMATRATSLYRKHHDLVNAEAQEFYNKQGDEFEFEHLTYVETLKDSRQVSNYYEPCIIISSAGMLEGGRIQDHLFYNIQNYYCTILFIGYCAKGTLGFRLLRGDPIVHIKDRDLSVYATIKQTDVLSAHGDHEDLVDNIKSQDPNKLKGVYLVHGEATSMQAMADSLEEDGYKVTIPEKAVAYEL
ncbi:MULTISPECIES: MBL fold metallo-hydrolase [unclassified Mucilaginibacter]|uniref:MBL fold metallo-hydrolase n=3 Tax=Mucilaginibacter TaxID=423349 RepID=UPI002AC9D222|nr:MULTISPECIES: MBL fold metallo-hydrolase [unclassified Mucilaginibacter]MEB0261854.1 MBL fold metallo-hydrolase [Mucilaginibacter sp. 10I4]MEB0278925.1 MBL fold metallo-hydrolase [Mucilaginibacter sp. 10B2]WPX22106.1 MBL fold metallo-hydrolase [Mucilaginibacter sp. 5C4]